MLKTLKTFLRKVDFYLRNEEYRDPSQDYVVSTHPFEDLFEGPEDPLRTRAYWAVRRFWNNHWLCNPRNVWFRVKCACQRVARGWDDRAVWSVDYWLDEMMPDILRKLKQDKHGTPIEMFDGLPTVDNDGYTYTDESCKIAEGRWDAIMDKMIAGFEASRRLNDLTYDDELGDYPLRRPKDVSKEDWRRIKDERFAASEKLRERDQKIFEEGMALFAKHYHSLWD